jgi:hypothetical protein
MVMVNCCGASIVNVEDILVVNELYSTFCPASGCVRDRRLSVDF